MRAIYAETLMYSSKIDQWDNHLFNQLTIGFGFLNEAKHIWFCSTHLNEFLFIPLPVTMKNDSIDWNIPTFKNITMYVYM